MCNRYNIKTSLREVASEIGAQIAFDFDYAEEIFPGATAPTLAINRDGGAELRPMKFGFDSNRAGGPTLNNARAESIEKWTWKKSFERYRCVVPMTSFREPCYWGPQAGKELNFKEAEGNLLLAAAIFSFNKPESGPSACSMSLVMRPAIPFVMDHGHHRSPFFLRSDWLSKWMDRSPMSVTQVRQVLSDSACHPSLQYDEAREMAVSWTKRKSANLKKRDLQISEIEKTGPLGLNVPSTSVVAGAAKPKRSQQDHGGPAKDHHG